MGFTAWLELNDSSANTDGHCLGPVTGAKFLHDVLNVHFHRLFRDEEFFSNISIAISPSQLAKNLHFALGKLLVAVMFSQIGRDLGRNSLFPGMDLANCLQQFVGRHTLQHITTSSGFEGALNLHIPGKGGEHDDASIREFRPNADHGIDASHVGKLQVHDRYVRLVLGEAPDSLTPTGSVTNQHHVGLILNDGGKTFVQKRMVVNDQNSNSIGCFHVVLLANGSNCATHSALAKPQMESYAGQIVIAVTPFGAESTPKRGRKLTLSIS